ncbi:TOMM precursor leader peptide-binding protein [Streptomyces sp. NPDC056049]|uniref:TOMM precursor leader peptide-binding protein n=1 Tax=Streptomyces sp. NPDC056049 TaxID=3345693 RepID=UPI0035D98422
MSTSAPRTPTDPLVGFKRHLRVASIPGEAVYLLSEQGTTALQGPSVEALAPLLDGTRTVSALLDEIRPVVASDEAARVITRLTRAGLLSRYEPAGDAAAQAYWDMAGPGGAVATAAVERAQIEVLALGRQDADRARTLCRDSGLTVAEAGSGLSADLTLLLCDDYLDPELAAVDAVHRRRGRPWLPVRPSGARIWVGPFFGRPDGPCWTCMAHRLRAHRMSQAPVSRTLGLRGHVPLPDASLAAARGLGLQAAVLEALKWVAGMRHPEQRAIGILDTLTLKVRHHPVQRRPQCPECGDPGLVERRTRRPVVPASRVKSPDGGSNDRALSPRQMLDRYRHLVDPVTGVVAEVRPAPHTPAGLNSYVSGRNLALSSHSLAGLRSGLRGTSGGKGVTAVEAETGALCEAVERYSSTRQGDELTVRDTLRGLADRAVDPEACQLFDVRQYRDRDRWNATNSAFQRVPEPFDPDSPTDWTPLWSLTSGCQRFLPTSLLYFGPGPDGRSGPLSADSNGNAAGSSLEDAITQGFLELVERDAVAQWWYNRTRHPAVDLDAFDEPWLAAARRAYAGAHREIWVLDLTSDFGIPVMTAVSRRTDRGDGTEDISFGFGAHFDPRLALRRAVTEMAQLLPADHPAESGRPRTAAVDPDLLRWWSTATVANQPYLLPDPAESGRAPGDFAYTPRPDIAEDITVARSLVERHGMELLVLDQTRPDIGLPVVKVVVPGMRHYWARFAPGRLFDVPVSLGRLNRPTRYDGLNPIPLFA